MEMQHGIDLDELCELETAVAMHGSARQVDATGHMCFSIGVALAIYAPSV